MPILCANMILEVGFGHGKLRRSHHPAVKEGSPYFLLGREYEDLGLRDVDTKSFSYHNITEELTFHWFKHSIMCRDNKWICEEDSPNSPSGSKSGGSNDGRGDKSSDGLRKNNKKKKGRGLL